MSSIPGPAGTAPKSPYDAPAPRPPAAAGPRRPRPPDQRGGELEPARSPVELKRRKFSWLGLTAFFGALGGCTVKFFFPRTLTEPKTMFRIGPPDKFAFGVDDSLQEAHRIWVCRDTQKLYVISAVCTHLGCTPNWVASVNKFKCPCHGSGYDSAGVNFEGPAPRPMDRCHVSIAPDGQIVVNTLKLYREPQWSDEGAFIPLA